MNNLSRKYDYEILTKNFEITFQQNLIKKLSQIACDYNNIVEYLESKNIIFDVTIEKAQFKSVNVIESFTNGKTEFSKSINIFFKK